MSLIPGRARNVLGALALASLVALSLNGCSSASDVPAAALLEREGADLLVEVHIPLEPTAGLPADAYPYPWIDDIEDFLAEHPDNWFDDGEELGDEYLFFLSDASEVELVALASQLASLPRVPLGAFVLVTDTQADMGTGRRIELSDNKD